MAKLPLPISSFLRKPPIFTSPDAGPLGRREDDTWVGVAIVSIIILVLAFTRCVFVVPASLPLQVRVKGGCRSFIHEYAGILRYSSIVETSGRRG